MVALLAAAGSNARGREQHYLRPRVDNLLSRFSKLSSNGKCTSTVPRLSRQIADFGAAKQKLRLAHTVFTVKMLPLPIETDNKQKNTKNERYRLVSQGHNMLIVETIDANKKRIPAGVRDRVTSLNDVSMYTDEDDKPLMEIFENIKNKENGQAVALDYKKASAAELADFMAAVLPNYDRDRVYNTDIKKLIQWYNILINNGYTTFVEEEENASETVNAAETAE